jgi:hypothetical protein
MDMKDFANYLNYKSFDEALHHIGQISSERIMDIELPVKVFQQGKNQKERKTA